MSPFNTDIPNLTADPLGSTNRKILYCQYPPTIGNQIITCNGKLFQLASQPSDKTKKAFLANVPSAAGTTPKDVWNWYSMFLIHTKAHNIYIHPYYCFRKSEDHPRGFTCAEDSDTEQFDLPLKFEHLLVYWSNSIITAISKDYNIFPKESHIWKTI